MINCKVKAFFCCLIISLTMGISHADAANSGEKTLSYWNALNDFCKNYNETYKSNPSPRGRAALIEHYMKFGKLSRDWTDQISRLPVLDVDDDAVNLVQMHIKWLRKEESLYGAKENLAVMAEKQIAEKGMVDKDYVKQKAAEVAMLLDELNNDIAALNNEGDRLRPVLSQRYGIEFPDLE